MCHLAQSHSFPHEVFAFFYIYIYIYIDILICNVNLHCKHTKMINVVQTYSLNFVFFTVINDNTVTIFQRGTHLLY